MVSVDLAQTLRLLLMQLVVKLVAISIRSPFSCDQVFDMNLASATIRNFYALTSTALLNTLTFTVI